MTSSPEPDRTAISWNQFKEQNLLHVGKFSREVPATDEPFRALVFLTAYSRGQRFPLIHVFFECRVEAGDPWEACLFRGVVPRYWESGAGDRCSPGYESVKKMKWGSEHLLRRDPRGRGHFALLQYHDTLTEPPPGFEIPVELRKGFPAS